ncbi:PKD domain-containing protein [Roseisolibacter sp. H3M3-2]|uniref:PKD domain-containing protein n=1 Tax=Roseisolibacter sp. H3M3-2 TaxID=3031323 RepID=UPI0023DACEB9|nr:PKD domain-containing protein [Roseisolibacter sp. H3M3-2]MDF1502991.1 PKD domain-containing protein [Roseisolibacter sp. H3M3-2]
MPASRRVPGRPFAAAVPIVVAALACADAPRPPTAADDGAASVTAVPRRSFTLVDDPVLVGAGDVASCASNGDEETALLLDGIAGTVFVAGDIAYESGTDTEFANCYQPSWGRHKARTRPAPGNHEYNSGGGGYYRYFGAAAGTAGEGYYSYDVGTWHVVALNSNVAADGASAQAQWLRQDLAANPRACTVAYWHHPVFSSGWHGNNPKMATLWRILDSAEVDLVLAGHDHHYERFAPQTSTGVADPRGIRQFIVGTGGKELRGVSIVRPHSEVRESNTNGVLRLTLHDGSYSWAFVPVAGRTFTDAGTAACVTGATTPPPENRAPVAAAGGPYAGIEGAPVTLSAAGSTDADGDALTYTWAFGDGGSATGVTVSRAFGDDGAYTATVTVSDGRGGSSSATATIAVANAAPSATFVAPGAVSATAAYTLALTGATDPSPVDRASLQFAFDCGTGAFGAYGAATSVTCPAAGATGKRTVRGRVRDEDGATRDYAAPLNVNKKK